MHLAKPSFKCIRFTFAINLISQTVRHSDKFDNIVTVDLSSAQKQCYYDYLQICFCTVDAAKFKLWFMIAIHSNLIYDCDSSWCGSKKCIRASDYFACVAVTVCDCYIQKRVIQLAKKKTCDQHKRFDSLFFCLIWS